jgi:large subunit ribosomal protein L9
MKVVLLRDMKDLGRAHDTVSVSDGHGLNFLIPHKFAVAATERALKDAELHQRQVKQRRELDHKLVAERLAALAEGQLVIRKKINEKGHLYDAVDVKEIAEKAQLPEEIIKLEHSIKEAGIFDIPVSFGEQFGKFSINIEAE